MLPAATLSALIGTVLFQQQAVLWSVTYWLGWALVGGLVLALQRPCQRAGLASWGRLLALCVLVAMLSYAWAQGRAAWRLRTPLPVQCEQRPLSVQGVIVSVPEQDARGQQVDLAVETYAPAHCSVPALVRLRWYYPSSFASPHRGPAAVSAASPASTSPSATLSPQRGPHAMPAPQAIPATLPLLHAGERWQFSVKLKRPHGSRNPHGFDYAGWCVANGLLATGSIINRAPAHRIKALAWHPAGRLARMREAVGRRIAHVLGQTPASAVIRALVIGDDSQLSTADWQLFVDTGINHLVSISGLHITMLAALGYACTAWLWRRVPALTLRVPSRLAGSLCGAGIATAYALLAGFSVPTQRTLYMLLTVMALLQRRRQMPLSGMLCIALCVVLCLDPWAVLAPGFWLSFGAVAVLAFALGGRLRPLHGWRAAVAAQWVVTLASIPLLILWFNQWSVIAPLANALAIPLVSLAVVPLSIAGAVLPIDAPLHLAAGLWQLCLQGLHTLRLWPWAVSYWPTPPLWAGVLALLGALICLLPKGWPGRLWGAALWLPALLSGPAALAPGQMQVTVLDVGQGLSVLVRTAQHTLLYDAGPAYRSGDAAAVGNDAGQRTVLPYLRHLGLSQLDLTVVSHDDNDHVGGMASVLAALPAKQLLSTLPAQATFFSQWQQLGQGRSLPHLPCQAGQHWQWDSVHFQVLSPAANAPDDLSDNNRSCVIRVQSAHGSLLLTGDIERQAEAQLTQRDAAVPPLASTVLTMPHHGSLTSSSPAFVQAVGAQLAIASVGYRNRFGHPKAAVLARYSAQGTQVLRTDTSGAVLLDFVAGTRPQVTAWRPAHPHYWETLPE